MTGNNSSWPEAKYKITTEHTETFMISVKGRNRWALEELMYAGSIGCTPINQPAPRWSAYIFNLRALNVPVETITETHKGAFAGTHARYVLGATVEPLNGAEVKA